MTRRLLSQLMPTLVALWGAGLAISLLTINKLMAGAPQVSDADVFRPGALMLLETIRLHRDKLAGALLPSLGLLALGYVGLLVIRARLYAVLVDAQELRASRSDLFSRAPGSILVTLGQGVLLLLVFLAGAFGVSRLPSLGGTMAPSRLVPLLLLGAAVAFVALGVCALSDLWRLSLFHERGWRGHFSKALSALRGNLLPLIGARTLRAAAVVMQGALALQLGARPLALGAGGATFSFIVMQSLVVSTLVIEVWWLCFANETLRAAMKLRCDTPGRDDARRDPSPDPAA